ncbi:hypothetical protein L2X99_08365 [Microbacterium sp. KUDC0406]|uniref:LGFP repeat-containing protein n=1 Tax=Microbacterium sp. KUDC0406 TaxID=2909588 RepID=UPI001F15DD47|nr:hypothetical protein [Microbacterium sp. KUDC0406]UJP11496.1 hypothetical protein L2X99_08365 [Microbacterium sp. KUDC0406]
MLGRTSRGTSAPRISRILTAGLAAAALALSVLVPATAASAAPVNGPAKTSLAGFSAGNIISDAVFTSKNTMTEAQIQAFFNSKVKTCQKGYTCLKDFRMTSVTRPADAYCKGYTGAANESAARIIYRVSQACNINPQVLIVMLQKEQGLVTHTWPSDWRYSAALGQGCPDTAPCDPKFVGFFHQIYGAARQMQIYMEGKYFAWYAPGKTWNILYNPNKACGTSPVHVANKATSALYYYTPYQPNAAALKAGYGTGDSCSAYGNRNFYNYFTDWFGSTQKPASVLNPLNDIGDLYAHLGNATGVLGKATNSPACTSSTARCTVTYANGIITWTKALGALTVYGPVYKQYVAQGGLGGSLGYPKETPKAVTDPNGDGIAQQFDRGWIHQSAAGTFASTTRTMTAYSAAGWLRGYLGWPTSREVCTAASCVQDFAGGLIGAFTGKPAFAVSKTTSKSIDALYTKQGGSTGKLGARAADRQLVDDPHGDGLAQKYQKGWIHASDRGTFSSSSAIMTGYSNAGWLRGFLGWPTAAEQTVTDPNGNGAAQAFEGGWIHSSSKGVFSSSARIMAAFSAAGWVRGALGWPTSAEICTGASCTQTFSGGIISFAGKDAAKTAVGVTPAAIAKAHTAAGGDKGALGRAANAVQIVADGHGGGLARKFAGGWIHSSAAGTFSSSTPIMTAYSAAGWLRGSLGWPTSKESCSGTYCSQSFQGGVIAYTKGKAAVVLTGVAPGAIDTAYKASGGSTGPMGAAAAQVQVVKDPHGNGLARKFAKGWIHASKSGAFTSSTRIMTEYSAAGWLRGHLGWPVAAEQSVKDSNGNGVAQQFENGWIHSSDKGTFTTSDRIMTAYSSSGWVRGALGWPTSAEICTGASCTQAFSGGIIAYSGKSAAQAATGVTAAAIAKAHTAAGGDRGALGKASKAVQIVADPRGGGMARQFAGGWIHSSAKGTFSSSTTIMTAYSKAGWLRGKLGWPTGAETCTSSTCTQQFTGGTISYVKGKPATVTYR